MFDLSFICFGFSPLFRIVRYMLVCFCFRIYRVLWIAFVVDVLFVCFVCMICSWGCLLCYLLCLCMVDVVVLC